MFSTHIKFLDRRVLNRSYRACVFIRALQNMRIALISTGYQESELEDNRYWLQRFWNVLCSDWSFLFKFILNSAIYWMVLATSTELTALQRHLWQTDYTKWPVLDTILPKWCRFDIVSKDVYCINLIDYLIFFVPVIE